ncbi:MAG: hypothetical protein EZS28_038930 [Streblomastix strix]|uniref:Uncharacterized protein n=1 Tax=Streblomastix strix TaxID=222440 RepID=A0A5J4U5Q7_9EUKA|nr:MAG: hypothetical protein EZS28_038930 [Streblomastix strix]
MIRVDSQYKLGLTTQPSKSPAVQKPQVQKEMRAPPTSEKSKLKIDERRVLKLVPGTTTRYCLRRKFLTCDGTPYMIFTEFFPGKKFQERKKNKSNAQNVSEKGLFMTSMNNARDNKCPKVIQLTMDQFEAKVPELSLPDVVTEELLHKFELLDLITGYVLYMHLCRIKKININFQMERLILVIVWVNTMWGRSCIYKEPFSI